MPYSPRRQVTDPAAGPTLRDRLYGSFPYQWTLGRRAPASLEAPPADPWPPEPARARSIVETGVLPIPGGGEVPLADGPWPSGTDQLSLALHCHRFGWLRDLCDDDDPAARAAARHMIGRWIAHHGRYDPLPWRPDVGGPRIAHWLYAHDRLNTGAAAEFGPAIMASLIRQARHLRRVAARTAGTPGAFAAALGLVAAGLALPRMGRCLDAGLALLDREAQRQILPDGGHPARSPALLLDVLRSLVEARAVLTASHAEVPAAVLNAIDRIAPALRGHLLGDGTLARFNGGTESRASDIAALLDAAGARGRALSHAPHSGFQRLIAGRTVIVVEAGPPPPPGADFAAHAGTLSLEMSAGRNRLIVNCGAHPHPENPWNQALRATAAHSTLVVDDTHSSELRDPGGIGRRRPDNVPSQRHEQDRSVLVECAHDGYEAAFGLIHRRRLYLAGDGGDLRGEDVLDGFGGRRFAVRFHLHPRVQVSMVEGGQAALLKPPSGAGWRFQGDGGAVGLEDSLYMDADGDSHRSRQLVIAGPLTGRGARIKWRLHKLGG